MYVFSVEGIFTILFDILIFYPLFTDKTGTDTPEGLVSGAINLGVTWMVTRMREQTGGFQYYFLAPR